MRGTVAKGCGAAALGQPYPYTPNTETTPKAGGPPPGLAAQDGQVRIWRRRMTMDHGRNKISSVRDDVMKKMLHDELRTGRSLRAEEGGELAPPGEDQSVANPGPETVQNGGTPPGMTTGDVVVRAELARHLGRSVYPADRGAVIATLRRNNAADELIDLAGGLPPNERYRNVQSIARALGLGVEDHRP